MNKTLKISQTAIDKSTNLVYNITMTNDDNKTNNTPFLKGTNNMTMKVSNLKFTTEMFKLGLDKPAALW